MLKLLLSRAGGGAAHLALERIVAFGRQRRQLLLVPEQGSHEAERALCAMAGDGFSLYGEVLSFTRLASYVFAQTGGLAAPTLDAGGRMLLMYAALKDVSASLLVYGRPSKKPAFLSELLQTLDECKQYSVTPSALAAVGAELDGAEGAKLLDLALIFGVYDAKTQRSAADPRDKMTRLAEALTHCDYLENTDVTIVGFTDFTPQEQAVLRGILARAESLTVVLTSSSMETDEEEERGIFKPAHHTAQQLLRMAQDAHQPREVENVLGHNDGNVNVLDSIEAQLFAENPKAWAAPVPQVQLVAAQNLREETEWVAAEILRRVREEGLRFRDVSVAARGFDRYGAMIEDVFARYGVPVFLDEMSDVMQKPVFAVVTAALETLVGGYDYDDVFRYLKTGFAGVDPETVDLLENYVLLWGLRGSKWAAKADWTMHPRGYGAQETEADVQLLVRLNAARRIVTAPLEKLRKNTNKTGHGQAISLYTFLAEICLPEAILTRAEGLKARGELRRCEEYRQLWDILCTALEQCARILDAAAMELPEFAQLLRIVLSQYDVGSIPVSLDRVRAGEVTRLGMGREKLLFFIGADDGALPQVAAATGLFTDDDRSLLASYALQLAPSVTDKLEREMTIIYETCAHPTQGLVVSWAEQGSGGEARQPAFLVPRLRAIFPQNETLRTQSLGGAFRLTAPKPALELAGEHPAVRAALARIEAFAPHILRMEAAAQMQRGTLSRQAVAALYGVRVPMSASRMEQFQSCHFAYFMQYGLRAKARGTAGFEAPEYGTFVHFLLEKIVQDKCFEHTDLQDETQRKTLEATIRATMEAYLAGPLGGAENKSPRFQFLFSRLIQPVTLVTENVLAELAGSAFRPIAYELSFGDGRTLPAATIERDGLTVSVSGFVDRVDGWVHEGKLYLRVVDYKTGKKSFDLTEIWNGLGLQMLLYLFTLIREGKILYSKPLSAAGVLYVPAREAIVAGGRNMTREEQLAAADAELERHGLVLDDAEVLAAMEEPSDGKTRFIPLKVLKDGTISGDILVTTEQLAQLEVHTQKALEKVAQELAAGNIAADPFWRGSDKNACQYCDFAAACQFEDGCGGDARRYPQAVKKASDFWAKIAEEVAENAAIPADGAAAECADTAQLAPEQIEMDGK